MKFPKPAVFLGLMAQILMFGDVTLRAQAGFSDNFNDENDDGWTRFQPLAAFGAPANYSFPMGQDPIQSPASPDSTTLGPGRAGSFRLDQMRSSATGVFDLMDWDPSLQQTFGFFFGGKDMGFGTLDGYAISYSTGGFLGIYRVDNEAWTLLTSEPVQLNDSQSYGFHFAFGPGGVGADVYRGANGVAGVTYAAAVNSAGFSGFFVRSDAPTGTADATFDNFAFTVVPEPSTLLLLSLGGLGAVWIGRVKARRRILVRQRRQQP